MRRSTTDGRYIDIGEDFWWDTTGTKIVAEETVVAHMMERAVGIVLEEEGK